MKRILICLGLIVIMILCAGCGGSEKESGKDVNSQANIDIESEFNIPEPEKYLADYSTYGCFVEGDMTSVVIGPFDYDGDVEYEDDAFTTYGIAEDAEFYNYEVTRTVDSDSGEENQEAAYGQISGDDLEYLLNSGFGFIWLNDSNEITKIVFYGELEIQE